MEGKKMQEGDEEIRVGVHIRGSPARASPFPVAAISLMLPRSASITVLKDVVATQHAASARQQPFSLIDPFALIRSAKVIFGGIVLSDTTTLAQAGVQDGASLNLVLASSSSAPSSPPVACYLSSLPRISELHPNVGLTSGGQRVLIVGTNFSRNCTCRFGPVRNLPLKYHRQACVPVLTTLAAFSEELLEVIAPPHPTGVVSVQICNPFPLAILRRVMRPTESEDTTETETETEAETDTASPLPGAGASGSWSNDDVLFHYISREQLEREVMVPVGADACREKIAEALYGMGASSINYRRDDEDGFMG
ncbi:uncharacterized protein ACA1_184640 [Acanthamoeba castellanii str. Neff]|uniref:Ubiquitin-like domain-containing protein n=1 Tax=Acanthamoeba castellanii (strain ATCC 30010 / Neff) TaxID=1257118 RepID=L8H503_ACACF|nr:uncharacterized protein ACA1_184640 [Acanthamoeba castellanii str. Neff]ELR20312.1 hypothetical protein ACA1_184640 [Acanthamoeba castellanii str. Neff]